MRARKVAIVGVVLMGLSVVCVGGKKSPSVVDSVDLEKYVGRWYAIASIPTTFERRCVAGTTADYTILENGQVEVVNTCYDVDGNTYRVVGRAWVPDKKEPGKLKVSFVRFLGLWLFAGRYWIVDLAEDYGYAVVGHPSYRFGWILSRTPTLPDSTFQEIVERLEDQGYSFDDFRRIDQSMHMPSPSPDESAEQEGCSQ